MAEESVDGRLSVVLSDEELASMLHIVIGATTVEEAEVATPEIVSSLRRCGLISGATPTEEARSLFEAFDKADRQVQLSNLGGGVVESIRAFVTSSGSTLLMNSAGKTIVERLDRAETPYEFARHMRLLTGPATDGLTISVPSELLVAAYAGDYEATRAALLECVSADEQLRSAVSSGDWLLRLMLVDQMTDGLPVVEDVVLLLSIGVRLFSIEPEASDHGEHLAEMVLPISAWARVSGWFFVPVE